jgi:hypothetical protein
MRLWLETAALRDFYQPHAVLKQCLLSGVKRTLLKDGVRSAYDPQRS